MRFLFLLVLCVACRPLHHEPASPYHLVLFVDAKKLDYSNFQRLCDSIAQQEGSYVGHAWLRLVGERNGKKVVIEGGHSGELGIAEDRYLEGVVKRALAGDPNPVRYLHEPLNDGFFQKGSGGHRPTFAAHVVLTKAQFEKISEVMENYNFNLYSLTNNQCVTLVTQVAALAGLSLQGELTLPIPQYCWMGGYRLPLWQESRYQTITLLSPDRLEESLREAVSKGKAVAHFPLKK